MCRHAMNTEQHPPSRVSAPHLNMFRSPLAFGLLSFVAVSPVWNRNQGLQIPSLATVEADSIFEEGKFGGQ